LFLACVVKRAACLLPRNAKKYANVLTNKCFRGIGQGWNSLRSGYIEDPVTGIKRALNFALKDIIKIIKTIK
jgi:hypothetical protein